MMLSWAQHPFNATDFHRLFIKQYSYLVSEQYSKIRSPRFHFATDCADGFDFDLTLLYKDFELSAPKGINNDTFEFYALSRH